MYRQILGQILLIFLVFSVTGNLEARNSSKERKKNEAIKIIKENSKEVSILAGIDPLSNDSLKAISVDTTEVGDMGEDPLELADEDDVEIDFETFNMLWLAFVAEDDEDTYTDNGIDKEEMMDFIMEWVGTPYRFAGDSKRGIDCSAFTRRAFRTLLDIELPRTAVYQFTHGERIEKDDLQFGDMVFFKTRNYAAITHVGIYLGDDLFAHSGSRHGVSIASLNSSYYRRKYRGARRLTIDDLNELEIVTEEDNSNEKMGG